MIETDQPRDRPASGWQATLTPFIEDFVRAGTAPGIVVAASVGDSPPEYLFHGVDGAGVAPGADTLYPVASITKLATALSALRLVAAGRLSLHDPVGKYLPDSPLARQSVAIRDLFCHTAGLPGDLPDGAAPYQRGLDWPALARACLAIGPSIPPRTQLSYGNLGFGLLAVIVERLADRPFGEVVADDVLRPLGVEGYLGKEPPRRPAAIAGSLGEHSGTDLEPFNSPFWRSLGLPWGGLVTTAAGAIALLGAYRGWPAGYLPASLIAEATRDQTGGLPGEMLGILRWDAAPWGLGPELRGHKEPDFVSSRARPESFGHGGSSGCLLWTDPTSDLTWFMHGMRTIDGWMDSWPNLTDVILKAIEPT